MFGRDFLERRAVWKIEQPRKIRLEPCNIAMRPTAVDQIILSINVAKHELVNRWRAIPNDANDRLPQQIMERPAGMIGDRHTDATDIFFLIMNIIRAKEEVIFSAPLCYCRRPHGPMRPGHTIRVQNSAVLRPIDEVR